MASLQSIKNHLIQHEAQAILKEQEDNGTLSEAARIKLMNHVCGLIFTTFGALPKQEEKTAVSKAVIKLFPGLKYKSSTSDGIVSFYLLCFWSMLGIFTLQISYDLYRNCYTMRKTTPVGSSPGWKIFEKSKKHKKKKMYLKVKAMTIRTHAFRIPILKRQRMLIC